MYNDIEMYIEVSSSEDRNILCDIIYDILSSVYYEYDEINNLWQELFELVEDNFIEEINSEQIQECKEKINRIINILNEMKKPISNQFELIQNYIELMPIYVVSIYYYDIFVDIQKNMKKTFL